MSSRGSFAINGHVTTKNYKTDMITESGVKVLSGIGNNHSLPELSHTPNSIYDKLKKDDVLHELRFFDSQGYPIFEIAYHPEPNINNGNRIENIVHYYTFNGLNRKPAKILDEIIKKRYSKYLKEFGLYDKC